MINELPIAFITEIQRIYPKDFLSIFSSFLKSKPLSIRVNSLKTSNDEVKTMLTSHIIRWKQSPTVPIALILPESNTKQITSLPEYERGYLYIQSLSSMLPALSLNPLPGEKVLDMAAAPGSKTTQMAAMMENKGEIVANDIDQGRIFKLKSILTTQGVTNTTITRIPGEAIWKTYPQYFDKVLLDAPCSMEGMFNVNDPKSYEHWSLKKVRSLSKLQKWMLRSAVSATKVGGTIVYSTCTLSQSENGEVIDWILEKEKRNIELIEKKLILPDKLMEGFFIAKIKKIKSNISLLL